MSIVLQQGELNVTIKAKSLERNGRLYLGPQTANALSGTHGTFGFGVRGFNKRNSLTASQRKSQLDNCVNQGGNHSVISQYCPQPPTTDTPTPQILRHIHRPKCPNTITHSELDVNGQIKWYAFNFKIKIYLSTSHFSLWCILSLDANQIPQKVCQ